MPRAALKLRIGNPINVFIGDCAQGNAACGIETDTPNKLQKKPDRIVHTLPYTMKFDGEHPILKAIVGVSHSIQPIVGRKLMKNTGNTLGNL